MRPHPGHITIALEPIKNHRHGDLSNVVFWIYKPAIRHSIFSGKRESQRTEKGQKGTHSFPLRTLGSIQNPGHEHRGETLIPAIPWSVNHI